jgi:hypothetical protein
MNIYLVSQQLITTKCYAQKLELISFFIVCTEKVLSFAVREWGFDWYSNLTLPKAGPKYYRLSNCGRFKCS